MGLRRLVVPICGLRWSAMKYVFPVVDRGGTYSCNDKEHSEREPSGDLSQECPFKEFATICKHATSKAPFGVAMWRL